MGFNSGFKGLNTLRGHESRPHYHDRVLRYAVTLQVCTHPKADCLANRYLQRDCD